MSGITLRDAVKEVLSQSPEPLGVVKIHQKIIDLNILDYEPVRGSVSKAIGNDLKKDNPLFKKVGKLYTLRSFDTSLSKEGDESIEFTPEELNFEEMFTSDLYVTDKLLNEIRTKTSYPSFDRGIKILKQVLDDWESYSKGFGDFASYENNYKIRKPIILGTRDEVVEYRKKSKGIHTDESRLKKLQLELINNIFASDFPKNIDNILKITKDLEDFCDQIDDGRYAYYVPVKCAETFIVHPVYLHHNLDRRCYISVKKSEIKAGYIVMPYDLEKDSTLIFTAKFYQALYHELFHSAVIDKYRGNKKVNEGLAELYSELCYYIFFEKFALTHLSGDLHSFFDEYMLFTRKGGNYLRYYKYVKDSFGYNFENDKVKEYDLFCSLINALIIEGENSLKEFTFRNRIENAISSCKDTTPLWDFIFNKYCLKCNCDRNPLRLKVSSHLCDPKNSMENKYSPS